MERNRYAAILEQAFALPTARKLTPGEVPESCSKCGGAGWIAVGKSGFDYELARCSCYQPPSVEDRLRAAGIQNPTSFAEWQDDPIMRPCYEACQAMVNGSRWCLFMRGGPGRGKTHLAKAVARAFVETNRTVCFRKVPRLLDELRSTFEANQRIKDDEDRVMAERSLTGKLNLMRDVELLILDDFGAHQHTPWASDKLYTLIDERYEARKPLLVTSNVKPSEEREHERTLDRLSAGAIVIKGGESRRREFDG